MPVGSRRPCPNPKLVTNRIRPSCRSALSFQVFFVRFGPCGIIVTGKHGLCIFYNHFWFPCLLGSISSDALLSPMGEFSQEGVTGKRGGSWRLSQPGVSFQVPSQAKNISVGLETLVVCDSAIPGFKSWPTPELWPMKFPLVLFVVRQLGSTPAPGRKGISPVGLLELLDGRKLVPPSDQPSWGR